MKAQEETFSPLIMTYICQYYPLVLYKECVELCTQVWNLSTYLTHPTIPT